MSDCRKKMTKILIVDDHPMFREALRGAVAVAQVDAEVSEVGGIEAACEVLRGTDLELDLVGTNAAEAKSNISQGFDTWNLIQVGGVIFF